MLVLVCGFIGVGKSTVAQRIAEKINGTILRTDIIRCKVYPNPTYTREEVQHVYELFFEELEKLLQEGKNVVVDATFNWKENRDRLRNSAKKFKTDFQIVQVICNSDEKIKFRIENRNDGVSKTNYKEYLRHKLTFEEIHEDKIVIDNINDLDSTYQQIDKYF